MGPRDDCVLPHMVFCTGCAGRGGGVELGRELASQLHTTTASTHNAEHHTRESQSCSPEDGHNDARNMLR